MALVDEWLRAVQEAEWALGLVLALESVPTTVRPPRQHTAPPLEKWQQGHLPRFASATARQEPRLLPRTRQLLCAPDASVLPRPVDLQGQVLQVRGLHLYLLLARCLPRVQGRARPAECALN